MALQHLRSSTANKRPTPAAMSDGQLAMNTNTASPGLFFKDSNGDSIKAGPPHVGTTAPNATPGAGGQAGNSKGELWLDTTGGTYVLKTWDGTAWRSVSLTGDFVETTGDTMTGALVMDDRGQVRFRETTANGTSYVALQAAASVASNKTITLPDATGTVVLSGAIVNADINASAAIADTKLATISTAGKVADSALPATISSNITGSSASCTGNAATATRLTADRTINGVIFNGTQSITATVNLGVTAGTTAGPVITSSAGTNATIPSASASAAGIVTTGTQTFAGSKTFTGRIQIATTGDIFSGAATNAISNTTKRFFFSAQSGDGSTICSNGSSVLTVSRATDSGTVVRFGRNGSNVGSISVTASATAYSTSSDYRLKENITPLDGAIARLNQLPVHRFNFIADPDTVVDGFIAHEAAAVVPECVTGEKDEVDEDGDPVYQGIDQSKVVPLLTAALQEAIAMINALEARIAALEA